MTQAPCIGYKYHKNYFETLLDPEIISYCLNLFDKHILQQCLAKRNEIRIRVFRFAYLFSSVSLMQRPPLTFSLFLSPTILRLISCKVNYTRYHHPILSALFSPSHAIRIIFPIDVQINPI